MKNFKTITIASYTSLLRRRSTAPSTASSSRLVFKAMAILLLLGVTVGCERRSEKPNIEIVQNMMESPAIKAQDYDPTAEDQRASLLPPEGTVAQGFDPYNFEDPDTAGQSLKNPLAGQMGAEVLNTGRALYQVNCQVCHGVTGAGNGPVAEYLQLAPPSLLTKRAREFPDGYWYHMIVKGRGLMGGYGTQIPARKQTGKVNDYDRWALVQFVRNMQKNQAETK